MGLCCSNMSNYYWCEKRNNDPHAPTDPVYGLFAIDSDDEEDIHNYLAGDHFDRNLIDAYAEECRELQRYREDYSVPSEEAKFLITEPVGYHSNSPYTYGFLGDNLRVCDGLMLSSPVMSGKKEGNALKNCKVVFVTGGPGSGKGTQCEKILKDFDVGHVSTGDLIRAEVETESERAKQLKEVMEKGELVSLDVVLELLREHLVKNASQHKGFLVDGFPRELDQATRFEKEVVECACMLYMDASEEEMKSRIMERAKTSGRADDNEETIVKRIETFKNNNDAIVKYFEEKSKLVKIDCNSTDIEAIYGTVKEALEKNGIELKAAGNANGTTAAAPAATETETEAAPKEEEEKKEEEPKAEAEPAAEESKEEAATEEAKE